MAGLTLIALCGLKPDDPWREASRSRRTVTKGLMDHVRDHFGYEYAPNMLATLGK